MPFTKETAKELGRKGGITNRDRRLKENPNHFHEIGVEGGNALLERYGKDYYRQISARRKKGTKK
jgi:hypothetical protein